jgi:polyhydroxyalkanoate synthesis repressor PhaR
VKRYPNRKLYDTRSSRYVTLEQIAEMIRQGEGIQVVDYKSKDDLTSITLAQIILEEERKQRGMLPLSALRSIIQSGGKSLQNIKEIEPGSSPVETSTPLMAERCEAGEEDSGIAIALSSPLAASQKPSPFSGAIFTGASTERISWLKSVDQQVAQIKQTVEGWQKNLETLKAHGEQEKQLEGAGDNWATMLSDLQSQVQELSQAIQSVERDIAQLSAAISLSHPLSSPSDESDSDY